MFRRMLTCGITAGFLAGLSGAVLHLWLLQPMIAAAERLEAPAHSAVEGEAHLPDPAQADPGDRGLAAADVQRSALTVLFTAFIYAGYGLVLVAGIALAEGAGYTLTPGAGLLWGLAGFATFQLAPALGLPPELPGAATADLAARQMWWWGTVAATSTGLALLACGRNRAVQVLALAVIAAPHFIGAPQPEALSGTMPPGLAAAFSARALGVGLIVWVILGALAIKFWKLRA
jgi:cobalt transporter subunit CbtA